MEMRRWWNHSLPQTLQIAVSIFYFRAVFGVLFGQIFAVPIGTLIVIGYAAGGFGMANERKWGYIVGLVIAGIDVLFLLARISSTGLMANAISLIFTGALVAALLHPMSREYQRVWFR
jgi:hypothetical protein